MICLTPPPPPQKASFVPELYLLQSYGSGILEQVRQSQIVQSANSDTVGTQTLIPVLSLGSQLDIFFYAEYEWKKA